MGFIHNMSPNLYIYGVFWMNQVQMEWSVVGRVAGAIRTLVNARDLQLECETLLVPVVMNGK